MGEMRRLNIVYFLSRNGSIEHPHLIRLHHFSRHGIRLRDVKRWLGEVRGKDMPASFSWSFKRRYKTGYVWQDLLDDDLITPVSDNEYVLKGSEISSLSITPDKDFSYTEDELVSKEKDHQPCLHEDHKTHSSSSPKLSTEIQESLSPNFGSETSTVVTDDSIKHDMTDTSASVTMQENQNPSLETKPEPKDCPTHFSFVKKDNKRSNKTNMTTSSKTLPHPTKSKSASSCIFQNLMTCGGVDTKDSVMVPIDKQRRSFLNICSLDEKEVQSSTEIICKRDRFGGSQRVFGTPNWTQQQWSARRSFDGVKDYSSKAPSAAYRPIDGPICSQCGKTFKPQKMHSHMKSCKGLKAAMSRGNSEKATSDVSMEFKSRESFSGIY